MKLHQMPLFERLAAARSVLVAGAGGGFDVYCGLPILFWLRERGVRARLANLSFTTLEEVDGRRVTPHVVGVRASTPGPIHYFPEGVLASWFFERGQDEEIFALNKTGFEPLAEGYRALRDELDLDCVVLVDGGTDILMRGDEAGLGTPQEDITSLAAVDALDVADKLVVCVGFGVDRFHGVCHAQFLRNVATLSKVGGYLGACALLPGMPEVDAMCQAIHHACAHTPSRPSIVGLSVASAVEGEYGDVHRTERTRGSKLWINPLMSLCWGFDLGAVARQCLYLDAIKRTKTVWDVNLAIEAFRNNHAQIAEWEEIPV